MNNLYLLTIILIGLMFQSTEAVFGVDVSQSRSTMFINPCQKMIPTLLFYCLYGGINVTAVTDS